MWETTTWDSMVDFGMQLGTCRWLSNNVHPWHVMQSSSADALLCSFLKFQERDLETIHASFVIKLDGTTRTQERCVWQAGGGCFLLETGMLLAGWLAAFFKKMNETHTKRRWNENHLATDPWIETLQSGEC
jgi:hypothetical protein